MGLYAYYGSRPPTMTMPMLRRFSFKDMRVMEKLANAPICLANDVAKALNQPKNTTYSAAVSAGVAWQAENMQGRLLIKEMPKAKLELNFLNSNANRSLGWLVLSIGTLAASCVFKDDINGYLADFKLLLPAMPFTIGTSLVSLFIGTSLLSLYNLIKWHVRYYSFKTPHDLFAWHFKNSV